MSKNGDKRSRTPFTRGPLYRTLQNEIYIGKIPYKGKSAWIQGIWLQLDHRYRQTGPRVTPPENLGKIIADLKFSMQIWRKLQLGTSRQGVRMRRLGEDYSGT